MFLKTQTKNKRLYTKNLKHKKKKLLYTYEKNTCQKWLVSGSAFVFLSDTFLLLKTHLFIIIYIGSKLTISHSHQRGLKFVWWYGREVGQIPPPSFHHTLHPSISPTIASLPLWLSSTPSPPSLLPGPPTFLTAGLLSCRYLLRDKRI